MAWRYDSQQSNKEGRYDVLVGMKWINGGFSWGDGEEVPLADGVSRIRALHDRPHHPLVGEVVLGTSAVPYAESICAGRQSSD